MSARARTSSVGAGGPVRAVIDGVKDYAIFVLDRAGVIQSWNEGARVIKGYAPEEIIGTSFTRFYTPEDLARGTPARLLAAAAADGRVEDEGWRLRKDGTRFWADVVLTALHDDAGNVTGFVKVTRDLTTRRNAEELLRQSEERLRMMIESVRDYAIFTLDERGYVSTWNAGAARLKGYRAEEILGRHFSLFYTPEDLAARKPERELEIASAEGRYEEEGWRVRKDGTLFWANVVLTAMRADDGRLVGFAKVTRDMTERREALEQLAARAQQQAAVAEIGVFALRTSSFDALAQRAVEIVAATLGTDVAEIVELADDGTVERRAAVGSRSLPLRSSLAVAEHTLRRATPVVAADLASDERFAEPVRSLAAADGVRAAATALILGQSSAPVGVLATYTRTERRFRTEDIDFLYAVANVVASVIHRAEVEQQRREADRAAADERLRARRAQEAVEERDEFISIAAHELRTPLTALHLKLESARQGLGAHAPDVGKIATRVDGALRQTQRLSVLVERLLDVSRLVSGRMELRREPTDLAAVARRVVDELREEASRTGSDISVRAPDALVVSCDAGRIEQVITNLLSNATKYGAGKPIEVVVEQRDAFVRVSIADHGIGIAAADLERIFARFERAAPTRNYAGLGLGLYISRRIVEAQGGHLRVDASPGRGATFTVDLPLR